MKDLSTIAVHGGDIEPRIEGAVNLPIFQTANYEYQDVEDYRDIRYARLNNSPNHLALHGKLAELEGGEAALALGSGMAAISSVAFGLLRSGDHIVAQKTLYGGTYSLFTKELGRFGIACDLAESEADFERLVKPATKMIYVESMSNPLLEIPDFELILKIAKKHSLFSVIDATFTTPVNFRPLTLGFDVALHSATKYLNGHSDVVAGAVIGRKSLVEQINAMAIHLGGMLDPHAAFLLHRGLKTLPLRVERQNRSALQVAQYLSQHKAVEKVNYPGLESHATFSRAKKFFTGFGGMMSFDLKHENGVDRFLKSLKLPILAPSLGGVESLVILPSRTSHMVLGPEGRKKTGIGEALVRFSVGLENPEDLIADLDQALAKVTP